jgi:ADP-heptose:LPS heptosyltransferase
LEFYTSDSDREFADQFLSNNAIKKKDFLVGINPAGNWRPKRWPSEYWGILADKLINEYNAKVVITGSPNDAPVAAEIKAQMRGMPLVTCGAFNLKQFAALCKRLNLFISADTGPLHIANAMGVKKIVAIFGPTSSFITGPYPLHNVAVLQKKVGCKVPCYVSNCKNYRCMKAISPQDVLEVVRQKLRKAP